MEVSGATCDPGQPDGLELVLQQFTAGNRAGGVGGQLLRDRGEGRPGGEGEQGLA